MRQVASGAAIAGLFAAGGWFVLTDVTGISEGKGHGSLFWFAVVFVAMLAVAAFFLAARIYRTRFANRFAKPS